MSLNTTKLTPVQTVKNIMISYGKSQVFNNKRAYSRTIKCYQDKPADDDRMIEEIKSTAKAHGFNVVIKKRNYATKWAYGPYDSICVTLDLE